jgi:hypothetical protein
MKKISSLILTLALGLSGLVSAAPARAQQIASAAGSISKLREEYERLLAVERSPETPADVRELNRGFLNERREQLAVALRGRIGTLRSYHDSLAATLSEAEKRAVADSIQRLMDDLRRLNGGERASAPARVTATAHRLAADPIEIVSPVDGAKVQVGAIEVEVALNDEAIDDVMVAVYETGKSKPFGARKVEIRRSDKGRKRIPISLREGLNRVEITSSQVDGAKAEVTLTYSPVAPIGGASRFSAGGDGDDPSPASPREQLRAALEFDWGRTRAYFTGGVVFSKERDDFSKSDLALSFVLDKNYIKRKRWNINSFFEARLSSVPVAARDTASSDDDDEDDDDDDANPLDTFITSRKAAFAQAGLYLPFNVTYWRNSGRLNTLFVAPIGKGGIQSIVGDRRSAEAVLLGADDVYNFFSVGLRFGHFSYPRLRNPCPEFAFVSNPELRNPTQQQLSEERERQRLEWKQRYGEFADRPCDTEADYAPELVSWLDITRGRWENFELTRPTDFNDAAGNPITVRRRPWRYQAEGRLKVPETPFMLGFDGNFGEGADDLRFGFGMRFDVGRLIRKLKVIDAFVEPNPAVPAATPAP